MSASAFKTERKGVFKFLVDGNTDAQRWQDPDKRIAGLEWVLESKLVPVSEGHLVSGITLKLGRAPESKGARGRPASEVAALKDWNEARRESAQAAVAAFSAPDVTRWPVQGLPESALGINEQYQLKAKKAARREPKAIFCSKLTDKEAEVLAYVLRCEKKGEGA